MRFSLYRNGVLLIENTPVPRMNGLLKDNEVVAKNSTNVYEIRYEFVDNNLTLCEEDCILIDYNFTSKTLRIDKAINILIMDGFFKV